MQIPSGKPIGMFNINTKSKPKTKHDADTEIKVAIVIKIKSETNPQEIKKMRGGGEVKRINESVGKTYITFVRFLPRMNSDMLLQRLCGRKLFTAIIALAALDYIPPNSGLVKKPPQTRKSLCQLWL